MKRAGLAAGFTLMEMAIVMVVIGLLLGGGLVAVGPVIENSNIAQTNQRLDRIEQALILHVIRYGCLPCPASPTLGTGTTDAGRASAGGAAYSSGCQTGTCTFPNGGVQGVVPWVNLGLSEKDISDGFSTRISYQLATTGLQQTNGMNRVDETYPTGDLIVQTTGGNEITSDTGASRAAYVLVSYGPDRAGGYREQTGTGPIGNPYGSTPEPLNSDGNATFVQDDLNGVKGAAYFDDIVRWRSAAMIVQLCGSGACGNPS
jgi:prepilin-type N-terminal cleavage/methylation domain-containing protein